MRRKLPNGLSGILLNHLIAIKGQGTIRIDSNEDVSSISVDVALKVALADVVEEGRVVEVHKLCVVCHPALPSLVHWVHFVLFDCLCFVVFVEDCDLLFAFVDLFDGCDLGRGREGKEEEML